MMIGDVAGRLLEISFELQQFFLLKTTAKDSSKMKLFKSIGEALRQFPLNSYTILLVKLAKIRIALKFKSVKQKVLLPIALLVAFLLTLPRVLSRYSITEELTDSFTTTSINDIVFRFIFATILFWSVLQLNTNWKYALKGNIENTGIGVLVFSNMLLFALFVGLFNCCYPILVGQNISENELGLVHFVYFIVALILVFVSGVLRYQLIHKEDVMENERLKQEKLKSELAALKNQINPHFLFNSLNSLNTLVRGNEEATTFVNKLSALYRYILQSGSQDLVPLRDELAFLKSYVHLVKTRYRDRFSITIEIDGKWLSTKIPVLSLQLLVENAVKHNEISESSPLQVNVFTEGSHLIVENKIQPKSTSVDSTGNGLANLAKRYDLLENKRIIISNTNNIFRVKLPLN